jgi:hypothetical protein
MQRLYAALPTGFTPEREVERLVDSRLIVHLKRGL